MHRNPCCATTPAALPAVAIRTVCAESQRCLNRQFFQPVSQIGRRGEPVTGSSGHAILIEVEIADHAGYSQAAIFFHFKTKAGLLEACLEEALARAKANLVPAENSGTIDLIQRLDRAFDNSTTADFFARILVEFGDNDPFSIT